MKGTILGVGSRLFDSALEQACQIPDTYTAVTDQGEKSLLLVFRCYDRITGNPSQPKTVICGVIWAVESIRIIKDWQILRVLNELAATLRPSTDTEPYTQVAPPGNAEILTRAESLLRDAFPSLDLPFRQPELELLGIVAGVESATGSQVANSSVVPLA